MRSEFVLWPLLFSAALNLLLVPSELGDQICDLQLRNKPPEHRKIERRFHVPDIVFIAFMLLLARQVEFFWERTHPWSVL